MIAFRVDINKQIASGHIMRCLTIAQKIRELGGNVIFISGDEYCKSLLESKGFEYIITNTPHNNWDIEIPLMNELIAKHNIKCLFIDSYDVSAFYLKELDKACKVVYIDDYLKEKYDISLLLAPTQSRDLEKARILYNGTNTKLLLGKDYLIIRDEFLTNNNSLSEKDGIFISTGGTDNLHFTLNFLKKLSSAPKLQDKRFFVILGSLNDDEQSIKEVANKYPRIEVMKNISNISDYMKRSSYAIAAGGNTLYELLCCKVPVSCIALSDDQTPLGERLSGLHIVSYEGDCRENIDLVINNCIKSLESFFEKGLSSEMRPALENFTDGLGATRIAKELIELEKDNNQGA